jgi:hypothetical protein
VPQSTTPTTSRTNGSSRVQPGPNDALGSTARMAARNRTRVLLGCLVLVISMLAAAVLFSNASDRHPVLVVSRAVAAGQVLQSADVRDEMVAVGPGVNTIPAADRTRVVGRTAAVALSPGGLLNNGQLTDGHQVDSSLAVLGASLKEGQYPSGLRSGDRVLAYVIPPDSASGESSIPKPIDATVVKVEQGVDSSGSIVVSVAVAPGDAGVLTAAAARNRLSLVLAPPG